MQNSNTSAKSMNCHSLALDVSKTVWSRFPFFTVWVIWTVWGHFPVCSWFDRPLNCSLDSMSLVPNQKSSLRLTHHAMLMPSTAPSVQNTFLFLTISTKITTFTIHVSDKKQRYHLFALLSCYIKEAWNR